MKINTNRWNKIRYTIYTPFYDVIGRLLNNSRKLSIESLGIRQGDKVLIVGAGTGLDLEFIHMDCHIVATDITPSMVQSIKKRNLKLNRNVQAIVMDGHSLDFADNSFDRIILHLILAVIPDPVACLRESERVLKPGGHIVVFDKFVQKGREASLLRKILNMATTLIASDISRDFEFLVSNTSLKVISDIDADFKGNFRRIKLVKQ